METTMLIIIIAGSVVFLIILGIIIYCCSKKKNEPDNKKDSEMVEIQVDINKKNTDHPILNQKQNIQPENSFNAEEIYQNLKLPTKDIPLKDSTTYSMSTTDRKLLGQSNEPSSYRDMKDSFVIVHDNEKAKNISYVEASFRNDLYNHVDTKEDKIKDLIEKANLANKPILEYRVEPKEEEKTSKDLAAENIINYTEGNRADFYSEANEENFDPEEQDAEIEMKIDFYDSNGNEKKRPSLAEGDPSKNLEGHEMNSEEHGDFLFDDIDEDRDEYYSPEYMRSQQQNKDTGSHLKNRHNSSRMPDEMERNQIGKRSSMY
jgi:hypothetical protein